MDKQKHKQSVYLFIWLPLDKLALYIQNILEEHLQAGIIAKLVRHRQVKDISFFVPKIVDFSRLCLLVVLALTKLTRPMLSGANVTNIQS